MSIVDTVMRHAREVQPDLWDRTEQIARIIDPAAFEEAWIVPSEHEDLFRSRKNYERAIATSKAQAVLRFMGVNTDADWMEIMTRMASK